MDAIIIKILISILILTIIIFDVAFYQINNTHYKLSFPNFHVHCIRTNNKYIDKPYTYNIYNLQ